MNRRQFVGAAAGISAALPLPAATRKPSIIELRWLQRTSAAARISAIGAYQIVIGPESPSVLVITEHESLAAWEVAGARISGEREEVSLLRSFDGMPSAVPPDKTSHIFELRMYESYTGATLARKIKMFNDGEIGIFQRLGMKPMFFGETIVGSHMPNLVYMLSFESLASRERLWSKFVSDPEWKKMSAPPELSDSRIVSNINNWILAPV